MKKLLIPLLLFVIALTLTACGSGIKVPDFLGQEYGDVLTWAKENNIEVQVASEYNDDAIPGTVISQSIISGETMKVEDEISIVYSRGYDPKGVIVVPDFSGKSKQDILDWLGENDINKFYFEDTYSSSIDIGEFVDYKSTNTEDRTETLRKDYYYFYFSIGDLKIEDVEFDKVGTARGVNLGGWFVLEGWMTPGLFTGVTGSDETVFLEEADNAVARLETHWNTFITEDDFIYLSDHNIDYVRIPIPWWYQGETFSFTHEGVEHNVTYPSSKFYIDKAMQWADKYDIEVLLDLHTAPGCQNGFDNGGISGVLQWERTENVAKTLEVLEDIATDFTGYDSLWGIELLNEPAWSVNLDILQNFYKDGYDLIRAIDQDVFIGMHDGFRMYLENEWSYFFEHNNFSNVFFDVHLYQTFGDMWGDFDIFDHLIWVEVEQYKAIHRYDGIVPVVVGEWSLGLQGNVYENLSDESIQDLRKAYGSKQLNVYEDAFGWFFWNYKIDQNSHIEWDMKRLIDSGAFPSDFGTSIEED
jgi:glucan 1,3-beta-glucosidase